MRKFLADTFALVVFLTLAGVFTELFIAGMTLAQSAQARATALPVTLFTARPYGLFRDWVFRASGAAEAGGVGLAVADIAAFVGFQVPIYAAILVLAGASSEQVAAACGTATVILTVSGRPYGLFLEFCRGLFGVRRAELRHYGANSPSRLFRLRC